MNSYGDDDEVQKVLSGLEGALETYLEAWRREFGMGERCGAEASPDATGHDAREARRVIPNRR